ncbi:MAG: hypothetical protein WCX61_05330 [Candidatus Peribacteraceae bacterium]
MVNRHDSEGPVGSGEFNILQGLTISDWSALPISEQYREDPFDVIDAWKILFAKHIRDLCDKHCLSVDEVMWRQEEFQDQIEHDLELHRHLTGLGWAEAAARIKHELREVQHDGQVIGYRLELIFPSVDGVGPAAARDVFFPIDAPTSDVRESLTSYAQSLVERRQYGQIHEGDITSDVLASRDKTEYEKKQFVVHGLDIAINKLVPLIEKGVMKFAHGTEILCILQQQLHLDYEPVAEVVLFEDPRTRREVTNVTTRTTRTDVYSRVKTLINNEKKLIAAEQFAKRSIHSLRQSISYKDAAVIFQEIQQKLHAALAAPHCSTSLMQESAIEDRDDARHVFHESQKGIEADIYLWISQAMKRLLSSEKERVSAG